MIKIIRGEFCDKVYLTEHNKPVFGYSVEIYHSPSEPTRINWGGIGSQSIAKTENFVKVLRKAISEAKKYA